MACLECSRPSPTLQFFFFALLRVRRNKVYHFHCSYRWERTWEIILLHISGVVGLACGLFELKRAFIHQLHAAEVNAWLVDCIFCFAHSFGYVAAAHNSDECIAFKRPPKTHARNMKIYEILNSENSFIPAFSRYALFTPHYSLWPLMAFALAVKCVYFSERIIFFPVFNGRRFFECCVQQQRRLWRPAQNDKCVGKRRQTKHCWNNKEIKTEMKLDVRSRGKKPQHNDGDDFVAEKWKTHAKWIKIST